MVNGPGMLKLVIRNVTAEHQGNYTCHAQNIVGKTLETIQLVVKVPPEIEITPTTNLTIATGESVILRCAVRAGNPSPSLVWEREGNKPLNSSKDGILVISSATGDSQGTYICRATNNLGTSEAIAFLTVQAEPKIMVSPSNSISVTAGSSVTLECAAVGDPPPVVQWIPQGHSNLQLMESGPGVLKLIVKNITSSNQGNYTCQAQNIVGITKETIHVTGTLQLGEPGRGFSKLVIETVGPEDEGNYTCQAQNIVAKTQETVQLIVKVMPKIEIMPARKLTVTGGESVTFRCVVKAGNPPPSVVWEREQNKPLNSSDNGVLVISRASGDSGGRYICKATNILRSTEAAALLIVQGEPQLIVNPSSPVSVTGGSSVTLECTAAGSPPPVVQWIIEGHPRSNLQIRETNRGVLKLIIENVRPEDQGNFTCQAENIVGLTQESVQLTVTVPLEPPEILLNSVLRTVIEGEDVEFRCNASGLPAPTIVWERLGSNLPNDALDRDGILMIPSVGAEDAGTYSCKAVNSEGQDSFSVKLEVIVPPLIDVTPSKISVNQGTSFSIFCIVKPSLAITWSKLNGSFPNGIVSDKGTLTVSEVKLKHAGTYRCYANNSAGSSEGFASVVVYAAPKVVAWPRSFEAAHKSNVTFHCNATGIPDPVISWSKEGSDIPLRHSAGVLSLTGVISDDNGRYICTAKNAAGTSTTSIELTVEDLPSVVITGGTSVKTVSVGKNSTLECIANGTPQSEIQWTRVDGLLPEGLISKGGQLIFPRARLAYGGVYRCKVTNRVGSVQSEVAIFVQEAPKVMVTPQSSRVKTGETVQFTCIASGSPSPDLTWRKVNGSLPVSSTVQRGVLKIANVTQKDAGSYNCEAKNVEGSANRSGILEIKVTVPRFTQEPLSYLSVQTLTDEPLNFTVEIVFIPEMADGLILYNDQLTNGSVGDFISFGMSDRFAEFRFNLGFEPAIIRSRQPLSLYEWHRVVLSRNRKEGNLTVDGEPPVTGISKGSSTGLNLNQDLHVGGVLDFSSISSLAGFKSGFIGCLSYLAIDGKVVNFGDPIKSVGLDDCEVCQTRPCKNGGTCTEVAGDWGFICTCRPGYSGRTCDDAGNKCSPGVCNEGRCENIGNDGFRCICPAGYSGERCEEGLPIDTPMFEGDSYMSLPGIEGAVLQLRFSIRFLALKSGNMLLLYNGQTIFPGRGDFISLAIHGGRVEFRFNMGSGTGILRSARNTSVGFWHTVIIERQLRDSLLVLDDDPPVKGSSPCCSRGLNLLLDLFIGGVKNFTTFHTSKVGVSSGLFGCISELSVDGREINLLKSNLDMRDIKQCTECLLPCELRPCLNNATCIPVGKTGFFCSCAPGYTGQKCEFTLADPLKSNICVNGGVELSSSDRLCNCPLGYGGRRCNRSNCPAWKNALFSGDGFLEFPSSTMRGPRSTTPDYMSLEIKTEAQNGVILWQGERRDHFTIGLRDGFLEFRFELGSGPAVLQSLSPVNDSQWHSIKVYRSFSEGSLKVDNHDHVNGTSAEGSKGLNINQGHSIFIGGGENIAKMTHGKFNTGFRGCIKNTFFKDRGMDLQGDAIRGWNVLPCDSDEAEP
ncbi:unnamed protein product [Porites lobata]|uniref:Basement membrane-specific heparan sulfate proteoglycan core protein n=1 Tax=Porites lobata TaxID=104759 RepID=A0ABN8S4F3_9CNID|nr:unnamed protein product [Porites lobata]